MNQSYTLTPDCTLFHADMLDAIKVLPDNCLDSCVTDPPYHLTSVVKRFGGANAAPAKFGTDGAFARASKGFMNKLWDGGDIAFQPDTWREVMRVLKPGGHVAAFGGSRGYHRMACAIEDAGFEIRDSLMYLYGTGFPKSHDVSKGIDKAAGAEREVVGFKMRPDGKTALSGRPNGFVGEHEGWDRPWKNDPAKVEAQGMQTAPATPEAREWQGWGTALKPAFEPIVLARKPLSESTVAANVLRWRTGALNIDGCRVDNPDYDPGAVQRSQTKQDGHTVTLNVPGHVQPTYNAAGRWPANVVHDGSAEVVGAFPVSGKSNGSGPTITKRQRNKGWCNASPGDGVNAIDNYGDSGSAARFFYSAKASKADRNGSKHPTVKPIALMQWLARLITPPGGAVLDPFAGSGTTGAACILEGFKCLLVEREAEYVEDIRRRFTF